MKPALRFAMIAALNLAVASTAGAQESWVGKIILVKKIGIKLGKTKEPGTQDIVAELKGVDYRVHGDKGGRLQVTDDRGNNGWFDKGDAVLLEDAIAYFTERIRSSGTDAQAYNSRARVRVIKGELDIAIQDYGEVLRLDPNASAYSNRGLAWSAKKDYDRAIADYSEAIRIDRKHVKAYNNRGNAWSDKQDYDKAIADYNEAIRLDLSYVDAYYNRGRLWSAKKEYDKAIADYSEAIRLDPRDAMAYNNRGSVWNSKNSSSKFFACSEKC